MNKLHSLAFCAMVTPVLTLGTGSVLADQSDRQDLDRKQQNTQHEQSAAHSNQRSLDQSGLQNRNYMHSVPANGIQASNLIGAKVKTTGDEDVGSVDDLIIDKNGKVAAIVVGVGGFLGLGEKNVAIAWSGVTRSSASDSDSDEEELLIDMTRQDLQSAPEFEEEQD